jgi:hypothetical protein
LIKDGKMRATLKAAEKILINQYTALLLLACAAPSTSDSPNLVLPRLGSMHEDVKRFNFPKFANNFSVAPKAKRRTEQYSELTAHVAANPRYACSGRATGLMNKFSGSLGEQKR